MSRRISSFKTHFILLCALLANGALAQSLSFSRKPDGHHWIEANPPINSPHTLQVSPNLHLWVDIKNDLVEPYSQVVSNDWVAAQYFRLTPSAPEPPPIRVLIIGDSMSADCCGWGSGMHRYFKPSATVINYAVPGGRTTYFLQSPDLENMKLIKPDYVLIAYGEYDGVHTPFQEFTNNLHIIVDAVRSFNGIPIMVTLHAARRWDETGALAPAIHPYVGAVKQVASEMQAYVIDLDQLSRGLFTKLGQDGCAFMLFDPKNPKDVMHFSRLGAVYVAQLIVHALPDSLAPYLTGIMNHPPKP